MMKSEESDNSGRAARKSLSIPGLAQPLAEEAEDAQAEDLADRIDAAAMTPDELAHVRDLDAERRTCAWRFRGRIHLATGL